MIKPDFWTNDLVKIWLREAARTEKTFPQVRARGHASLWPNIIHDQYDAYGWEAAQENVCKPSSEMISRYDYVSLWFRLIDRDLADIAWKAAHGIPHKIIMNKHGCSRTTLHDKINRAHRDIATQLNRGVNLDVVGRERLAFLPCSEHVPNMFRTK